MQADPFGTKDGTGAREENRRRGLEKEEWLLWGRVVELGDVIAGLSVSIGVRSEGSRGSRTRSFGRCT